MIFPKTFTFILLAFSLAIISSNSAAQAASFVDPHVILRDNFQGWGTSLAWWADVVGGMESEIVDHVVDAIFSVWFTLD